MTEFERWVQPPTKHDPLDEILGIDPSDPMQARADALVTADSDFMDHLVEARERLGLTQQDVAERLGVGVSVIRRIEVNGMDESLSVLRRYALALGVVYQHQVLLAD